MARRLANNLKDEYLSCSICLEQYKMPKTLPCDHIFCQDCLNNHVKRTIDRHKTYVEVTCPLCRHKVTLNSKGSFDVEAWVISLPTDSLVGSLMQTLNKHERGTYSPDTLPKLCQTHSGKPCDAYCFTHAHLMCWECAAREHRLCSVDSADKARHLIQPEIDSLKKTVENHLARARELSENEETFTNSKTKALDDLQEFENNLDKVFSSAKHQISLLKAEIDNVTKLHQDKRKSFYDAVTSLLELHCSLEILSSEQGGTNLFATFEDIKKDVESSANKFKKIENEHESNEEQHVKFVRDEQVQKFLSVYSGIGFIDSNVSSSSSSSIATPRTAPKSLSHIFKRSKNVGTTKIINK